MEYVQAKDERQENAMMNREDKADFLLLRDEEPVDSGNRGSSTNFKWFQKPLELMVRISKGKYRCSGGGGGDGVSFMGLGVNNTGIREPVALKERLNTDRKGVGFRRRKKKNKKKTTKDQQAI